MAVAIRLTRVGATKRPAYRVIAIDKRRSRDGRALEILGYYDPLTEPATVNIDTERINAWIGKGAQPSETVVKLMHIAERVAAGGVAEEKPKRTTRAKPKAAAKAGAKAPASEAGAGAEAAEPAGPAAEAEADADAPTAAAEAPAAEPEAAAAAEAPSAESEAPSDDAPSADEKAEA